MLYFLKTLRQKGVSALRRLLPTALSILLALTLAACGGSGSGEQTRALPFTDITAEASVWQVETCNLVYSENGAALRGRVKNVSPWVDAGLTMYVRFLDEAGEVLVTGSCMTVLDKAVEPNGVAGYTVNVLHFFDYDSIASVTIEFGK